MDSDLASFCNEETESDSDLSDVQHHNEEEEDDLDESSDEEENVEYSSEEAENGWIYGKNRTTKWFDTPQSLERIRSVAEYERSER